MFIMDVPYAPAQNTPIVLAQAATSGVGSTSQQPDFLLKVCTEKENEGGPTTAMNALNPAGWLAVELSNRSGRHIEQAAEDTIKPVLLESTKHGKLIPNTTGVGQSTHMQNQWGQTLQNQWGQTRLIHD